jgi:hypothetical protein
MFSKHKEDLLMQPRKPTRLQNLQDGCPFIIEPLKEVFKLMYLIRGGDSTCKVQGYKQTDAGGYSPFVDFFAPATEVVYDEGRERLPIIEQGGVSIPKEYLNTILNEEKERKQEDKVKEKPKKVKKMKIEIIEKTKAGAGRPKKHSIELPRHEEFTVSNIAAKLGVKKFVVNNHLAKIQRENPESIKVVGSMPQSKGKPAKVFKLI